MPLDPAVAALRAEVPPELPTDDLVEHRRRADEYQDRIWPLAGLTGPELPTREHLIRTPGARTRSCGCSIRPAPSRAEVPTRSASPCSVAAGSRAACTTRRSPILPPVGLPGPA